jgi:uncharacterized protein (TIGR02172 family)
MAVPGVDTTLTLALSQRERERSLIGRGFTADVYAWEPGRVVKLFHPARPEAKVELECRVARAVHAAGLPAPAVFDLLEIDGRRGMVMEHVEGVSLFKQVQARPWKLPGAVRQLAELHAKIHQHSAPAELPSQREWIVAGIEAAADLSTNEKRQAQRCLADLPDGTTLCHGDFHPENVILTPRGPLIIDWSRATRGHPLCDVACTCRLFQTAQMPAWAPSHMHLLARLGRSYVVRTYRAHYLKLHRASPDAVDAWNEPLAAAAAGWGAELERYQVNEASQT